MEKAIERSKCVPSEIEPMKWMHQEEIRRSVSDLLFSYAEADGLVTRICVTHSMDTPEWKTLIRVTVAIRKHFTLEIMRVLGQ
jgi:hypothetical protein